VKRSLGPRALLYPMPVVVVGSYDPAGKPNGMTAAWAGIVCSRPPCVAVAIRRSRHSHRSILERRAFTVNVAAEDRVREVDYFGLVSGADVDKFAVTGLTPVRADKVDAPGIEEFPLVLECRLLHDLDLGTHTLFVGEVLEARADEAVLGGGGLPDIARLKPLVYAPGQMAYFSVGPFLAPAFEVGKGSGA
jgi:flavin reductase (DIM6/NTAB) family NADH-FMN oxidoreductase RutF